MRGRESAASDLNGGVAKEQLIHSGNSSKQAARGIVVLLLVMAIAVSAIVGTPTKGSGADKAVDLPDVALGQEVIYRLEIVLCVFYGGLLIATPVYRGVVDGSLPIEISARGAQFAEETSGSIERTNKVVKELQDRLQLAQMRALRTRLNVDQLAKETKTALRD
jgi:hypothetical protein